MTRFPFAHFGIGALLAVAAGPCWAQRATASAASLSVEVSGTPSSSGGTNRVATPMGVPAQAAVNGSPAQHAPACNEARGWTITSFFRDLEGTPRGEAEPCPWEPSSR